MRILNRVRDLVKRQDGDTIPDRVMSSEEFNDETIRLMEAQIPAMKADLALVPQKPGIEKAVDAMPVAVLANQTPGFEVPFVGGQAALSPDQMAIYQEFLRTLIRYRLYFADELPALYTQMVQTKIRLRMLRGLQRFAEEWERQSDRDMGPIERTVIAQAMYGVLRAGVTPSEGFLRYALSLDDRDSKDRKHEVLDAFIRSMTREDSAIDEGAEDAQWTPLIPEGEGQAWLDDLDGERNADTGEYYQESYPILDS